MMSFQTSAGARNIYFRDNVVSASPSRLLTMLYDRLLLDLHRAEQDQVAEDWLAASPHLVHAQAIITELVGTLKPELWEGAEGLQSIYFYALQQLRTANANHDVELTRECVELLEPLRVSWHAAVDSTTVAPQYAGISAVG